MKTAYVVAHSHAGLHVTNYYLSSLRDRSVFDRIMPVHVSDELFAIMDARDDRLVALFVAEWSRNSTRTKHPYYAWTDSVKKELERISGTVRLLAERNGATGDC